MIIKLGEVMLYVNEPQEAKKFWLNKLGFDLISEGEDERGMRWVEVAPNPSETSLVLIDKKFVEENEPYLNVEPPSLMFYTTNLDQLYTEMQEKAITVGEKVVLDSGERVFNFADDNENYFAVMEVVY